MRRFSILVSLSGAVAATTLVTACNRRDGGEAVDKVQDAVSAPIGQTSAAIVGANLVSAYVPAAAIGDLYEIQSADIALERSTRADVKALAKAIKTDHMATSNSLMAAVQTAAPDVRAPTVLDERRQVMLDNLRSASTADFDKTYLNQQVAAHEEAVILHQGFSDKSDTPALSEHARMVLPKIEAHLEQARALLAAAPT